MVIVSIGLTPSIWIGKHTKQNWIWQAGKIVGSLVYGYIFGYLALTDHNLSALISHLSFIYVGVLLLDVYILSLLKAKINRISSHNKADKKSTTFPIIKVFYLIGMISLVTWIYMDMIYPLTIKQDLYNIVHVKEKKTTVEATDVKHIPTVPIETARYAADKEMGKLANSSYYQVGELSRQKINNEEFWVAPLQYKGFFSSRNAKFIPGYIKISAEDKDKPAELVDTYKLLYTPSSFFGKRLERMVRDKFPQDIILGTSFEPNDEGKPFYIVAVGHFNNFRAGSIVDGAVIVDPQTGGITKYKLSEMPAFVDFVIPINLASAYNEWQATYKHGLWNSWFGHTDVNDVTQWNTGEEVIGVFGPDGGMYWFSDHSTPGSNSLVGYTLMNGRTGEYTYYTGSRGMSNGKAALDAVHNTFKKDVWTGTNPVLYNIYGSDTWYIPVVDANGLLRKIALVNGGNTQILAYGDTKQDALNAYKLKLSMSKNSNNNAPTTVSNLKELTGKVIRVGVVQMETNQVIEILLENSDKVFTVNPQQSIYSSFVQEGDIVKVGYADTDEIIVSIEQLFNETIHR
jgi:hypothetical protein